MSSGDRVDKVKWRRQIERRKQEVGQQGGGGESRSFVCISSCFKLKMTEEGARGIGSG